jgi:hydrogenase nickel incorporation protein HypA/HybF
MHEFSIAQNIVEIVEDTIHRNRLTRIEEIELEVGELSGIEITAMETALECLLPGSLLENAKVNITIIKGIMRCRQCNHEFASNDMLLPCPNCQSLGSQIIAGKELRVKSISGE